MNKKVVVGLVIGGIFILLLMIAGVQAGKQGKIAFDGGSIGQINIEGVIAGGSGSSGLFSSSQGMDEIVDQLHRAQSDPQLKALIIRINSPGGSSAASQEVGEEINKLRKKGVKVIISMGDVAASGGYWIAASGDKIVANPSTMTGSIGVIMEVQNMRELYNKLGIENQTIKSGPLKDMGSSARALTPEEQKIMQDMVNDVYEQFIDVVATGRHMDREDVRKLADGRVYTGRQAKKLGLVDELGNYYDALNLAKKMAGVKGDVQIRQYTPGGPFNFLFGSSSRFGGGSKLNSQDTELLKNLLLEKAQTSK